MATPAPALTARPQPAPELARASRRRGLGGYLFALPALLWVLVFFAAPLLCMLAYSFFQLDYGLLDTDPSLYNYRRLFGSGALLGSLWNSIGITLCVVLVSLLLAWPLAWSILNVVPRRWQRLVLALAILPFWTSYVVRSYAWLLALAPTGVVNQTLLGLGLVEAPLALSFNNGTTVIGFVHFFIMLNTLTIYANLAQINPRYALAARDLGASRLRTFLTVSLPLSLPGIAVGAFLTVVLCIGDYVTPQILGGNRDLLLPQAIMLQIQREADFPMASAMGLVLTVVVALVYLLLARWLRMSRI